MKHYYFIFFIIILGIYSINAYSKPTVDDFLKKDIVNIKLLNIDLIKKEGYKKDYKYKTLNEVYHAIVLVAMQLGFIMEAEKSDTHTAITVIPNQTLIDKRKPEYTGLNPFCILTLQESDDIMLYIYMYPDYFHKFEDDIDDIYEYIHGTIAIQLYSTEKWKYIYE